MSLYLVATPIGNLEDITLRALRILREADLIACEDTRHSRRLLDHYDIRKPLISYHDHNERERAALLLEHLKQGERIAVITDAGTPGISDPAWHIVNAAIAQGIEVVPIPGPVALIAALTASGLPTDSFLFLGFLPAKRQARRERLTAVRQVSETLVAYEAPHRITETLLEAQMILGDRKAALVRELTKLHEQFLRGTLSEISQQLAQQEPRGELTLVIAGCGDDNFSVPDDSSAAESLGELVRQLMKIHNLSRNDALKQAAKMRGLSRREAYRRMLEEEQSSDG